MIYLICFLCVHYLWFLSRIYKGLISLNQPNNVYQSAITATIIIPFRNESEKILKSLESIENQSYSINHFEVIYVDDNSEDDSLEKLKTNISKENIRVINLDNSIHDRAHKKQAIEAGIGKSDNEIIVITDADCTHDIEWLNNLLSYFENDTALVSGPVQFSSDGTMFQELQQIEFSSLIIAGAGLIGSGTPTICNSANLAFRKKVFYEVDGYNDNKHLSSGDDEFLMQKIANTTKYNIKFCTNKKTIVKTEPNSSLTSFFEQRKRWASKGVFYKENVLILKLVLIFLFYVLFPSTFIIGLFLNPIYLIMFFSLFIIKGISEYFVMSTGQKIVYGKRKLKYFFLAELVQIPYIIISSLLGLFGNYSWKGRKVER
ncbi:MAG: glycosyltransferase [Melioribacteraceae bacterium]|nr:glycosyltransferase [Melioribacteraceae bacterium]